MKHVPNILSVLRLLMIPVFAILLWEGYHILAGVLYIIATLTDVLDGYLARKYHAITDFGKFADPAADKLLHFVAMLVLFLQNRILFIFIAIFFIKEILMLVGGLLLLKKHHVVEANWFGKMAAVMMNISISASVLFHLAAPWVNLLMGISVGIQLFALALYTRKYFKLKKKLGSIS